MRKHFLLGMFAAATMLFATSCQKEELGTEVTVSFALSQPGIATKAYSDGLSATKLTYAVYEAGTTDILITSVREVEFNNKQATVNLRLVTGKSYDILFWADAEDAPYTFDPTDKTITVDYTGVASQDESRDAFYAAEQGLYIDGASSRTITLKRPFAQLNIGTTDTTEAAVAGFVPTQSSVTVSNVYSSLNLLTGTVSGPVSNLIFDTIDIPTNESFPVNGAKYLSMNYLLVSADKELVDVDFFVTDGTHEIPREFISVPVQRNYRTNIYGKLLTSQTDFNIVIDQNYDNPGEDIEVWDDVTVEEPELVANEWIVRTAAEWVYLTRSGAANKNIKLAANIDFGGYEINAITSWGSLDGQGYTISNFTLLPNSSGYTSGLFQGDGHSANATIKNVTIANINAINTTNEYGWIGVVFGDIQGSSVVNMENVHVKNADLCGVKCVAGLVGFVASGATLNVDDCSVDGSYFHNYPVAGESGYVAGLVGRPIGTVNVTNSTVTNTTINAYYAYKRGKASIQPLVGDDATLTAGDDVVITKTMADGAEVNGTHYQTLADAIDAAGNNDEVILSHGTHSLPVANNMTLTFKGVGAPANTIINIGGANGNLSGSTVTFENLTLKTDGGTYIGLQHIAGATYRNCIIENTHFLYGPSEFEDCTFEVEGDAYNVWTYGTNPTFTRCTFNCDAKAVLIYNENASTDDTVTFNNCTFVDREGLNKQKAAIETGANHSTVKHTININNCQIFGFSETAQDETTLHGGDSYGTSLWGNKNLMARDNLNVFINGTEVY